MADRKYEWLEVLRGLAAVWVVLHHGMQSVSHFLGTPGSALLATNGHLGVDFFFVLSGFIIAFSVLRLSERGEGFSGYLQARLVRIYVPYLPVGIGILALYLILPGLSEGGRDLGLITSVTLLPTNSPPALSVAWTLVHEMIFYAIFSIWFVSKKLLWTVMIVWIAFILYFSHVNVELTRFQGYFFSPLNLYFAAGVGLLYFVRAIVIGNLIALLLVIAGLGLVAAEAMFTEPNRILVGLGFAFLVVAATSSAASSLRAWSWSLNIGAASYAIYLVHNPVLALAARVVKRLAPDTTPWTGLLIICSISLVAGLMYWQIYERNALKWVRLRLKAQ